MNLFHHDLGRVGADEAIRQRQYHIRLVARLQRFDAPARGLLDCEDGRQHGRDEDREVRGAGSSGDRERLAGGIRYQSTAATAVTTSAPPSSRMGRADPARKGPAGSRRRFAFRRDDVNVDALGLAHDAVDDGPLGEFGPSRPVARAEHDLRRVLGGRERDQAGRHVVADHAMPASAELFEQSLLATEQFGLGVRESVAAHHVRGDQIALGATRHPRGPDG